MNVINVAMRALQFLWTLLIMALVGNMVAMYSGPAVVNYSLFVAVFSMLTLLYLIPAAFEQLVIHPILPLVLDVLNVVFTFCAAVAMAASLRVHSCSNTDYVNTNSITSGSSQRCHEGQASTAFLWFLFASYVVSLAFTAMSSRGGANTRPSGIRRGPVMSQV